ncbi:MAG TPA: thioredoxin domain-containing protein [Longimicrobiales bacterium]|nr:thioredoxin domain-containing protein [Longimicrobiales bacterium]
MSVSARTRAKACSFAVAALLAGATLLSVAAPLQAQRNAAPPTIDEVLEAAAMARARGAEGAPVVVFEIADFQCPYCARFAEDVFPHIDSAYVRTGLVQWVYVNLPLPAHREAWGAAEAALCAGAVSGRFWPMHDLLYARQDEWSGAVDAPRRFEAYAREAGVDTEAYDLCVADDRVAPLIVQDVLGASAAQIAGTPTFIVNRESKVVGLRTFEEWREILDAAAQ